jgi:hypothetical protein
MEQQPSAYEVMEQVAEAMGYHGICPEMLEQLKSEVAEDGDFPCYAGWWSNMVRWAYYQVMRDLRQMFAPAV